MSTLDERMTEMVEQPLISQESIPKIGDAHIEAVVTPERVIEIGEGRKKEVEKLRLDTNAQGNLALGEVTRVGTELMGAREAGEFLREMNPAGELEIVRRKVDVAAEKATGGIDKILESLEGVV